MSDGVGNPRSHWYVTRSEDLLSAVERIPWMVIYRWVRLEDGVCTFREVVPVKFDL
jgi:hypothetical protein